MNNPFHEFKVSDVKCDSNQELTIRYGIMPLGTLRYLATQLSGELRDDIRKMIDSELPDMTPIEVGPTFVDVLR